MRRALATARAAILVGTRAPLIVRQGYERELFSTPLLVIGPEPAFVATERSVHLRSDVRSGLKALLAHLDSGVEQDEPPFEPVALSQRPSNALSSRSVLAAVHEILGDDTTILVDAGNTGAQAIRALQAPRHGRWLLATGMAGMGYTFGAAIGAALASGKRAVVIAGDGAFFMHGMEIHTAIECRLPITYIILNNNAHAMCLTRERLLLGREGGSHRFSPSHIGAGVAAMFPCLDARDCATPGELQEALASGIGADGPARDLRKCRRVGAPPVSRVRAGRCAVGRSASRTWRKQ